MNASSVFRPRNFDGIHLLKIAVFALHPLVDCFGFGDQSHPLLEGRCCNRRHVARHTAVARWQCGHKAFLAVEFLLCARKMKTSAKRKAIITTKSEDSPSWFENLEPLCLGLRLQIEELFRFWGYSPSFRLTLDLHRKCSGGQSSKMPVQSVLEYFR